MLSRVLITIILVTTNAIAITIVAAVVAIATAVAVVAAAFPELPVLGWILNVLGFLHVPSGLLYGSFNHVVLHAHLSKLALDRILICHHRVRLLLPF